MPGGASPGLPAGRLGMDFDLSRKDIDVEAGAKRALKDEPFLSGLLANLKTKRETVRFNSFKILSEICRTNPETLYPRWDVFVDQLLGDNTYWKLAAIPLIAGLTRVDRENKFEKIFGLYYGLLEDRSFIPGVYLAKSSAEIVAAKPHLETRIVDALLRIDATPHHPERRDLVKASIIEFFSDIMGKTVHREKIVPFVQKQLHSSSPKTRKAAATFLEKWDPRSGEKKG